MIPLKNCPFCDSVVRAIEHRGGLWVVNCCSTMTAITEDELAIKWNTRKTEQMVAAALEEMQKATFIMLKVVGPR